MAISYDDEFYSIKLESKIAMNLGDKNRITAI